MTPRAATWFSRSAAGTPRGSTRPTVGGPGAAAAPWEQGSTIALLLERVRPGTPLRDGPALYRALPREDVEPVLLVTDLHAGNLLAGADGTWRLIDPKPFLGDP